MSLIAVPLRSVFHVLCNVHAPSAFSADKFSAALPQAAPHNPCPVFPISTSKGCHNNPLVIPGYSPPKRYKPYPSPRVFPSLQHLALERNSERTKRRRARYRRPGGSAIQPPVPAYTPHPHHSAGVVTVAASIPPMAEDGDVEMDEAIFTPEVDLIDVEMLDDFLP